MGNKMAQEWWSKDETVEPAQTVRQGVVIPKAGPTEREIAAEQRAQSAEARAAASAEREAIKFEQEQAEGGGAKPTEAQQKTLTLLTRIAGGQKDIEAALQLDPEAQQAGLFETLSRNVLGEGVVTRGIAGPERRMVTDAQADILDSLLTLGTGAAYTREQLLSQTVSYFPQYGDTQAEIDAKNERLGRLIESARIATGPLAKKFDEVIVPLLGGTQPDKAGQLQEAFNRGATIEELNTLAGTLGITPNQADLQEAVRYRDAGGFGARILPPETAPEETGFFEGIVETVTGAERSTPEIEALPEWTTMPELNELSLAGARTGIGTMFTSPEESVQIIQANYPGVQVRQDSKGNYILRSQNGQEYAIKPGFRWSDVPRAIGGILAFTPAGRATTVAGTAGGSALTQAGIEATQAAAGGQFDTGEIAIAGGFGAGGKVIEQALPAAVSAVRGARREAPVAPAAPTTPVSRVTEELVAPAAPREIIEAGERAGIPVMTSDIRPPQTFMGKAAQVVGERIPFIGTGGMRATQQEAREEAVKDFILENAGAVPADVEERIVADVLRKRGDVVEKYTNLKREVFSGLAGAGEVTVDKTVKAIDDQIAELSKARTPAADEAIAKLQEIRAQAAGRNIEAMEAFRRDVLGKAWQDDTLSVGASDRVKAAVKNLYGPFKEDMGQFILDRGGRTNYNKWRISDARLSDSIQEANRTALKSILRRGEATPEVINNMLFSGKKSDVSALYKSLTPEGQALARMAIVNRIAKDMGVQGGDISAEKFISQINKRSDQLGVFFGKAQQEELKGLVRVLNATRRASGAGVKTQTGQENFPLLLGALGLGDILKTGGIGTAISLAFTGGVRAYESKPIRNLMAMLSKSKPGSKEEAGILAKLSDRLELSKPELMKAAVAPAAVAQGEPMAEGAPIVRIQQ